MLPSVYVKSFLWATENDNDDDNDVGENWYNSIQWLLYLVLNLLLGKCIEQHQLLNAQFDMMY